MKHFLLLTLLVTVAACGNKEQTVEDYVGGINVQQNQTEGKYLKKLPNPKYIDLDCTKDNTNEEAAEKSLSDLEKECTEREFKAVKVQRKYYIRAEHVPTTARDGDTL